MNDKNWCHYSDMPSPISYMNTTQYQNYQHKSLVDINSNYIKEIFKFFCYEYTQMYKDNNSIKESIERQIEKRFSGNTIQDWKININEATLQDIRDVTIHNILNEDKKRYPIKIELLYRQHRGSETEICQFIIE